MIDVIRGFALFGVQLANLVWATQLFALTKAQRAATPLAEPDRYARLLEWALVDFKFYTLFAMLFGVGFALQQEAPDPYSRRILARRLAFLFLIGAAHTVFLWYGDILRMYAIVGFVLLAVRGRSDRTILTVAAVALAAQWLLPVVRALAFTSLPVFDVPVFSPEENYRLLTGGDWSDVVRVNVNRLLAELSAIHLGLDQIPYWTLGVLWKFLLGYVIGRHRILQNAGDHVATLRRALPWLLVVGLGGNLAASALTRFFGVCLPNVSSVGSALLWIPVEVSMFALSMAYAVGLILLHHSPRWRPRVRPMAAIGRMALSNYLFQSLLMVVLFYGVGAGLLGKVGTSVCVAIAVATFVGHGVVSTWWLERFRYGPAEWVWRSLTFGRRQPMRRAAEA